MADGLHRRLIIMAKAPRAFAVKSRLARQIGVAEATRFYRVNLTSLVRRVGHDRRWATLIAVAPDPAEFDPVWPAGVRVFGQGRGDLGHRMQRVIGDQPPGPVIIIGSDIPGIEAGHIAEAFRILDRNDVVFGPAPDGGYWLVGLRRRPNVPRLFSGVRWSTRNALADTLANCQGLSVGMTSVRADVDNQADWRRWRRGG